MVNNFYGAHSLVDLGNVNKQCDQIDSIQN